MQSRRTSNEHDDEERIVTEADIILAERTLKLYGRPKRSRFDSSPGKAGNFACLLWVAKVIKMQKKS